MNENAASMTMDDDEDPSASIDALVGKFLNIKLSNSNELNFQLMSIPVHMIYLMINKINQLMNPKLHQQHQQVQYHHHHIYIFVVHQIY